jgi:TonB-linked SusC/RagA family outer membrane protein
MNGNWIDAYNSSSDDLRTVGMGKLELASVSSIMGEWKWLSYYLNGEYGYRNKYFLSYNMAVDGSSRFGNKADGLKAGDNVFGVFPSITAAWLISSENFFFMPKLIELLKLRAGYSVTGNDGIGNYNSETYYNSLRMLSFNGLVLGSIGNPKLRWETVYKINLGIDAGLFNERLLITFDVFKNTTKDLLNWKQAKDFMGVSTYVENDGTMTNTGFELGVNGRILNGELKWDAGVNIGKYKNKITELSEDFITDIAGGKILTGKGKPLGLFYGYKTDGVYATTDEANAVRMYKLENDDSKTQFKAGDVRFVKQTDGDILTEADMTVIGDPNPDWYGSIVNRLSWKRFTLNMVFTYSIGNDIYNAARAQFESMTGYDNQTINVMNRWVKEGHVTNTPRVTWGDPMGNSRFSDRWIEDGSYLRLKSLSISYDIPLKVNIIRGLQVYATGLNILTFTKYLGYDPEFSAMQSPLFYGIDTGITPLPRSFILGVKLGL